MMRKGKVPPKEEKMKDRKVPFTITLDPKDKLVFQGDFSNRLLNAQLMLTNETSGFKAIKIKCSDNTLFHIRPPVFAMAPNTTLTVTVACESTVTVACESHHIVIQETHLGGVPTVQKAFARNTPVARKFLPIEFVHENIQTLMLKLMKEFEERIDPDCKMKQTLDRWKNWNCSEEKKTEEIPKANTIPREKHRKRILIW